MQARRFGPFPSPNSSRGWDILALPRELSLNVLVRTFRQLQKPPKTCLPYCYPRLPSVTGAVRIAMHG